MAAHTHSQHNELSGSFQSRGGSQFIGSIINAQGNIYLNSMSSYISNKDRSIQYVPYIGWPFLRPNQVISRLIQKQVLLYRSLLSRNQRLAEFLLGVKPF